MDVPLPSTRELELEMLLREKEDQIVQLSDEVSRLRLYLSNQPPLSTTEPVTIPPTFASLILPNIPHLPEIADATEFSNNSTTAALTQRVKVLQDENDELYDILKRGETGRLKEEVQSLKRVVNKLENALRESHDVIISLSNEVDKSYQAFTSSSSVTRTTSPQSHYHNGVKPYPRSHSSSNSTGGRHPPTGPRAHTNKKQRLSQVEPEEISPSMRSNASLPSASHHGNSGRRGRSRSRSRSPRGKSNVKMEVDEVQQEGHRRSPERVRWDKERSDKERGSDRDRGRERDRDGNRSRRSGGVGGRGGSRRGERGDRGPHYSNGPSTDASSSGGNSGGDRTLAERMGL